MSIAWYLGKADKLIGSHSGRYHLEAVLSRFSKERRKTRGEKEERVLRLQVLLGRYNHITKSFTVRYFVVISISAFLIINLNHEQC